jgi:hypothetical protein
MEHDEQPQQSQQHQLVAYMVGYYGVTSLSQVVKGGYFTGFLTDWNDPHAEGTRPLDVPCYSARQQAFAHA